MTSPGIEVILCVWDGTPANSQMQLFICSKILNLMDVPDTSREFYLFWMSLCCRLPFVVFSKHVANGIFVSSSGGC